MNSMHSAPPIDSKKRGFTLLELMVTVVIMGVLASIAVYGVTSYVRQTKSAEAREIIGHIMTQQEAYFTEVGTYLDVTGGTTSDSNYYPQVSFDGKLHAMWGGDDGCVDSGGVTCNKNFQKLGVYANQPVMFRYATTSVAVGSPPPVPTSYVTQYNPNNITMTRPGYVVVALSDLDGDPLTRTAVVGSSMAAQLHLENVGK